MKIVIIGSAGIPARYGGFETMAHHLATRFSVEHEVHVYCSNKIYKKEERTGKYEDVILHHVPLNANGMSSIPYDLYCILHALTYADTFIILGVSGAMFLPFVRLFNNKQIITSVDGLEWKRNKWSKPTRWMLKFFERMAVRFSHAVIADNLAIQEYIEEEYGVEAELIEYGADHVQRVMPSPVEFVAYPFLKEPYAFTVCRIEPENNIHIILDAFTELTLPIIIVGNWNASDYGKQLRIKYSKYENIQLLHPIYQQRALDVIRSNAYLYMHGHSAGGTNPSLIEAMHLNLPVFAFDVSFNRATTENAAFYFSDAASLANLVKLTNAADIQSNRAQMLNIAMRRYNWSRIANKFNALFQPELQTIPVSIETAVAWEPSKQSAA
jgi:glycosyltransferase involved in cell wall biosynthesis